MAMEQQPLTAFEKKSESSDREKTQQAEVETRNGDDVFIYQTKAAIKEIASSYRCAIV